MKLYKLTDEKNQTYNQTQWGENITHEADGKGELCGPGWIHAYTDPLLAVLLNPLHANFKNPNLWEAEGEIEKTDHGLKIGTKKLTTIKQLSLPEISNNQKIKFAILCARVVYKNRLWNEWADKWLSGVDRTAYATAAASAYAATYATSAATSAATAATSAANAATSAANATAANFTFAATYATSAATSAAYVATYVATYAATAATYAAYAASDIDLCKLAQEAMREEK